MPVVPHWSIQPVTSEQDITADVEGHRIFLLIAVVVVPLAATVGYIVGANSTGSTVQVLGTLSLPATGIALAIYGLVLSGVMLTILFSLVAAASWLEN